jgi:class 3 adenylate cyclase
VSCFHPPAATFDLQAIPRWLRLVAAFLAGASGCARAAEAVWALPPDLAQQGESWNGTWRFHPGDDPAWKEPGFDDTAWATGTSAEIPLGHAASGWSGLGWFRLRIDASRLASATPLVLSLRQAGAAEVWLDGRRVARLGSVGTSLDTEQAVLRNVIPAPLRLGAGPTHVLAVRYSNFFARPLSRIRPGEGGFTLYLSPAAEWMAATLGAESQARATLVFFIAVPLLLAVIHFALFAFLPRSRESLYCGLFMTVLALFTYAHLELDLIDTVPGYLLYHRLFLMAIVAFSLFSLLTIYATFARPAGAFAYTLQATGLALLVWPLFDESQLSFRLCAAFGLVVSVEAVRVTALAVRARRDGARLVLAGMAWFGAAVIYNALRIFGLVPEQAFSTHTMNFGILGAALGMSLFIARNYALTARGLERKLVEVEALSRQNLEHERARQRLIAAQNERLEIEVRERTADLQTEKEKSDQLLANILPDEIATELKATGASTPRRHEEVTILFSDFSGFTSTVSTIPAQRLIRELNEIFRGFDDIAAREGIEKIKTIGDAYMAAAGLPEACPDHAQRAIRAALAMQAAIDQRNTDAAIKWRMRVGLHSGPVVAGVVGKRKFTFDVFGDTVNLASRMETSAEPGQINLSAYTYDLVRDDFACDYRGKLDVKGKGPLDLYTVRGPRERN